MGSKKKSVDIKESLKVFILVLYAAYSQIGYSLLAPLFPFEAKQRDISPTTVGFIFSSFGVSILFTVVIAPKLIEIFGRKRLLIFGLLIEGICTCLFGLNSLVQNKYLFISNSFLVRLSQGIGSAIIQTLLYSIVASLSSEETSERNIGYIEFGDSVGVAIGPVIASLSYHLFGFILPFLLSGIIEMTGILLIRFLELKDDEIKTESKAISDEEQNKFLPENKIDEEDDEEESEESEESESDDEEEEEEEEENEEEQQQKKGKENPNVLRVLFGKLIIFLIFACVFIDSMSLSITYPVFAVYLYEKFQIEEETTALFFIIQTVGYFVALQFIGFVTRKLKRKKTMVLGAILNSLFLLLLPPIFILPQKISIIIVGLFGLGIAGAFISIPSIKENIGLIRKYFGIDKSSSEDYSSCIYNMGYYFGETTGSLIGGFFTEVMSFQGCCLIVSGMNLLLALALYLTYTINQKNKVKKIIEPEDK